MLLLSRVIGRRVLTHDGRIAGRLTDLTVRLDGDTAPRQVRRVVLRLPGGRAALLDWDAVGRFHAGRVVLAAGDEPAGFAPADLAAALQPDEILLGRDVLDTQIVDVVGQRLARVADVVLGRSGGRLEVLGVEVGFGGVLRRLGLRRMGAGEDIVAWTDLHLTSERGHRVQLSTPRSAVHRLDPRSLAALVSRVDADAATEILAAKEPAAAADAVRAVHPDVGARMLWAMPRQLAARIVEAMPADQATRWRERLAHRPVWGGRRFLRSGVWPRRRHLIRGRRG